MRLARIVIKGVELQHLAEEQTAAIRWIENSGMRPSRLGDEFIGIFNEDRDDIRRAQAERKRAPEEALCCA
jgi:hypothetical protein